MTPYLNDKNHLPTSAARILALAMIQHDPDEVYETFPFDGNDIGIDSDDEIVVTYTRRRKRNDTLKKLWQNMGVEVVTPVLEYHGEGVA